VAAADLVAVVAAGLAAAADMKAAVAADGTNP